MADQNNQKPDLSALRIDREKKKYDNRPRRKIWVYLFIPVVTVIIIAAYFIFKEQITPATKVKIATATMISGSKAQSSLVATGYVVAQRKAEVASKGTGRLMRLDFEEGDSVLAQEIIAILDNKDIEAYLEVARANLMKAEADLTNTQRHYRRQKELSESELISETDLEDSETALKLAEATVAGARASVKAAEVDLENTYILAPFDGTILTKNADVGEIVAPFASSSSSKGSVVTLADMNSLEVEADVSESNIHKVTAGQPCEIILDAYPDLPYSGYVKKIVPTADRARSTVLTKVAFDQKDNRVLPEMSARVNFFFEEGEDHTPPTGPFLGISSDAITSRNGAKVVFRLDEDRVQIVSIETGRELGEITEIISGLSAGDRVVLSPPGKMQDGQKIEISN